MGSCKNKTRRRSEDHRLAGESIRCLEREVVVRAERSTVSGALRDRLRRAVETATPLADTRGIELRLDPGVVALALDSATSLPLEELKATDPGFAEDVELLRRMLEA